MQNHEYSRGLPEQPRTWRYGHRMPGDPENDETNRSYLSRFDTAMVDAPVPSIEIVPATSNITMPDAYTDSITNVSWLRSVTNNHLYVGNQGRETSQPGTAREEWKYENRRNAQQITPFLFLGPAAAAKNEQFLRQEKITLMLVVRALQDGPGKLLESRTAARMGIEVAYLDVPQDKLVAKFLNAIEIINTHLARQHAKQQEENAIQTSNRLPIDTSLPARVLIYDFTGNETAAVVTGAYLVSMYGSQAWEATLVLQSKRFCITAQLVQEYLTRWHDIVSARKQSRAASSSLPGIGYNANRERSRKRSMEVEKELESIESWTMQGSDAQFPTHVNEGGRTIAAPFADRSDGDHDMYE